MRWRTLTRSAVSRDFDSLDTIPPRAAMGCESQRPLASGKAGCGEHEPLHLKLRPTGRYQPNQMNLTSAHRPLDQCLRAASSRAARELLRSPIRAAASATRVPGTMTIRGFRTHPCTPLETQPSRASQTKQGTSCASSISTIAVNSASVSGETTLTKSGISQTPCWRG